MLAIYDTSEFVVSGETHWHGLTLVGSRQSFMGHYATAVPEAGPRLVHGSLGFLPYVLRDRTWLHVDGLGTEMPLTVGTDRWIDLFRQVHRAAPIDKVNKVVHVMDREGDCFALLRRRGRGDKLSAVLSTAEVKVCREVAVGRRADKERPPASRSKTHPDREARMPRLTVRYTEVELRDTGDRRLDDPPALVVTVIDVIEDDPPEGEAPIHWRLLHERSAHRR